MTARLLTPLLLMLIRPADDAGISDFKINCPNPSVEAKPNETVILQCVSEPRMEIQKVEWMLNDTHEVHLYRDGKDDYTEQWGAFKDRTSLFHSELPSGNCSLRLTAQMSHSGKYRCAARIQDVTKECFLNLTVLSTSQLHQAVDEHPQTTSSPDPAHNISQVDKTEDDHPASPHPGVIAAYVFGVFALIFIIVLTLLISKSKDRKKGPHSPDLAKELENFIEKRRRMWEHLSKNSPL